MEGKSKSRTKVLAGAAAVIIICVFVMVYVPGATRVSMAVKYGLNTADMFRNATYIVGSLLILACAAVAIRAAVAMAVERRAAESERYALQHPYTLPKKDETEPAVIIAGLRWVAEKHPTLQEPLEASLEQFQSIMDTRNSFSETFERNVGLISDDVKYSRFNLASYEAILDELLQDMCLPFVGVIQEAHRLRPGATVTRLKSEIGRINGSHQLYVDKVNQLAELTNHNISYVGYVDPDRGIASRRLDGLIENIQQVQATSRKDIP